MKEKILTFIIGCLVGAIIATAGFMVYGNAVDSHRNHNTQNVPQTENMDLKFQGEKNEEKELKGEEVETEGNVEKKANKQNKKEKIVEKSDEDKVSEDEQHPAKQDKKIADESAKENA